FSSRRRDTRLVSDWSSDVCSSDLEPHGRERLEIGVDDVGGGGLQQHLVLEELLEAIGVLAVAAVFRASRRLHIGHAPWLGPERENGRASCRERVGRARGCGGVETA